MNNGFSVVVQPLYDGCSQKESVRPKTYFRCWALVSLESKISNSSTPIPHSRYDVERGRLFFFRKFTRFIEYTRKKKTTAKQVKINTLFYRYLSIYFLSVVFIVFS